MAQQKDPLPRPRPPKKCYFFEVLLNIFAKKTPFTDVFFLIWSQVTLPPKKCQFMVLSLNKTLSFSRSRGTFYVLNNWVRRVFSASFFNGTLLPHRRQLSFSNPRCLGSACMNNCLRQNLKMLLATRSVGQKL